MQTLTAEQRLQKARTSLLRDSKWQYLAGILMLGKHTVVEDMPTAATNGRDVQYGRRFVEGLTEPQLRGLILHEAFHVMYRHLTVWRGLFNQNATLANLACDFVINIQILDAGETLPPGACVDEKYRNWTALQVFGDLQQRTGEKGAGVGKPLDEHDWEGAQDMSEQEKSGLTRDIDAALREGLVLAGRHKGSGYRHLQELLEPVIDWRAVLREFIVNSVKGNDYATWRRPARRHLHAGIYLPSLLSDRVGSVVIAVDTSGSIGGHELQRFISEVVGVCAVAEPERVDLLYWGSGVAGHETYEGEQCKQIQTATKPANGGGTDVSCVFDYLKEHHIEPTCIVVLTDGYTPWPAQVSCPVLWAITTRQVAPWGVTVPVKEPEYV